MAIIKIRGRKDPIEVSNERGNKLKHQKFGFNGIGRAEPNTPVDLGDIWCGLMSQIESIEIERENKSAEPQKYVQAQETEYDKWWFSLTPEQKGAQMNFLKLQYQVAKGGSRDTVLPDDVLEFIKQVRTEYFREHPKALHCPLSEIDKALKKAGKKGVPVEEMEKALQG